MSSRKKRESRKTDFHWNRLRYEREGGGWLWPGSRGSVVSALDFQTLILSLILVEVSLSYSFFTCH